MDRQKWQNSSQRIGGWFGNPFLSFGMPLIIGIFLSLFFPFFLPLIWGVVIFEYILEIVFLCRLKFGYKEEDGWKTISLSPPPKGVKRVTYGKYEDYKFLRDNIPNSEQWEWFAFNDHTGDRIDYPKNTEWSWEQQKEIMAYFEQEIKTKKV